uniref:Uncharacterized protein n=1 Tax=Moniliophthora roreri TaxID=221103 RepID=A0A0W0FMX7_MONRR
MSVASDFFVHGVKITPFVEEWSTTTKIESMPSHLGRFMIKSIVHVWKGRELGHAAIDKALDKFRHSQPPEVLLNLLKGVPLSWVPYPGCFMYHLNNSSMKLNIIWHVDPVFKKE